MTKNEMLEASNDLEKDSLKYFGKALLWSLGLGACIRGLLENYSLSSNHKMLGGLLKDIAKKEES